MDPGVALHHLGGVGSYAQLTQLCSKRRLRDSLQRGEVVRLARGRYGLAAVDRSRKHAAGLNGVVSHLSAAMLWGWPVAWPAQRSWVTVPRKRHLAPGQGRGVQVVFADLDERDVINGVTAPVRTVLDCAKRLPVGEALSVADSALRSGLVEEAELIAAAHRIRGRGAPACRQVTARATGRAANPFESMLRSLVLEFPCLVVEAQGEVVTRASVYHPDLVLRAQRVVIEADSWEFHTGKQAHERDCIRYTELTLAGWAVIRFTWHQVMYDPDYVRAVLGRIATMPTGIGRLAQPADDAI